MAKGELFVNVHTHLNLHTFCFILFVVFQILRLSGLICIYINPVFEAF